MAADTILFFPLPMDIFQKISNQVTGAVLSFLRIISMPTKNSTQFQKPFRNLRNALFPASFEVEDPVGTLYMVALNEIRGTITVTEKLADTILATGSATSGRMDDETLRYSRCWEIS